MIELAIKKHIKLFVFSNDTFENFIVNLTYMLKQDVTKHNKYLWMMCFLHAIFDIYYVDHISYNKPIYAIRVAYGEEPYAVFLESLDNNDFVYMK